MEIVKKCEDYLNILDKSNKKGIIINGRSGLAKTFTILKLLESNKKNYKYAKAVFGGKGDLYKTFFKNNDCLLVLDECDEIIKKSTNYREFMLSVLETTLSKRRLTYMNLRDRDIKSTRNARGTYPQSFEYTGKIIFITNLSLPKINPAIVSRCLVVDFKMNNNEVLKEIEKRIDNLHNIIPLNQKVEVLNYIKSFKSEIKANSLEFRKWEDCLWMRKESGEDWQDYIKNYILG